MTYIPVKLRMEVLHRDGARCVLCGSDEDLCLDHIHPSSKDGPTSRENLRVLCRSCNLRKSNHVPGEPPRAIKEPINVIVPKDVMQRVREVTRQRAATIAGYVRQAIEEKLEREREEEPRA